MADLEKNADSAAAALKAKMGLPSTPVRNAAYHNQEPPPGSYAAMAQQQNQQNQMNQEAVQDLQRIPVNPTNPGEPPQTPQVAVADPGVGQPPTVPPQVEPEPSARAEARIAELARQRREYEQRASAAEARSQELQQTIEALNSQQQQLQQQMQEMMQANLDHLDPEARAQVMAQASARQAADELKRIVMSEVQPIAEQLKMTNTQLEITQLASRYTDFDYEKHYDKVIAMKKANPNLSIEQAFHVVRADQADGAPSASSVPPVLSPRGARGSEHIAEPPPKDPDLALREERDEWRRLARSGNPEERKQADRMLQEHLKNMGLGGR